jgi:hypothetical protein
MQPGDVFETYADIKEIMCDVGFRPMIFVEKGLDL